MAENKVLCDADVDAADLHLIAAPDIRQRQDFQSGQTALIDTDRCTRVRVVPGVVPVGCHQQ